MVLLQRASQEHDIYCHDHEVLGSKPGRFERGLCNTYV